MNNNSWFVFIRYDGDCEMEKEFPSLLAAKEFFDWKFIAEEPWIINEISISNESRM